MKKQTEASDRTGRDTQAPRTLAIDIGGSGIKAMLLDPQGSPISHRMRLPTPKKARPKAVLATISRLAKSLRAFDRASVGFPGEIKDGVVYSAVNLGGKWKGFDLEKALCGLLKCPVKAANDADVQGLGSVSGHGLELVITLGTGFGSVIFADGHRIHMELGHHPFRKGRTYEDELGHRALVTGGKKKWNHRLRQAIDDLKGTFNYDKLYIGGGNVKFIGLKLPADVKIVSNTEGLLGGIALWREPRTGGAVARNQPLAGSGAKVRIPAMEPSTNGVSSALRATVAKRPKPRKSTAGRI